MDQLHTILTTKTWSMVVSDAAVHNNRQATCAWIIWAGCKLWSREGYVPGHPDEMYSGLAEAYEVATVLGFLNQ